MFGIFWRSCIKLAFTSDQTGDAAPVKVLVSPTVTPVSQHKRLVFFLFFQLLYKRGIHPRKLAAVRRAAGWIPPGDLGSISSRLGYFTHFLSLISQIGMQVFLFFPLMWSFASSVVPELFPPVRLVLTRLGWCFHMDSSLKRSVPSVSLSAEYYRSPTGGGGGTCVFLMEGAIKGGPAVSREALMLRISCSNVIHIPSVTQPLPFDV